jgi:hypothetical protein
LHRLAVRAAAAPGDPRAVHLVRLAPLVAAICWMGSFVVSYGPTAGGASTDTIAFLAFIVSCAIAFASGAYERQGTRQQRSPCTVIDWEAFDRARASWHED